MNGFVVVIGNRVIYEITDPSSNLGQIINSLKILVNLNSTDQPINLMGKAYDIVLKKQSSRIQLEPYSFFYLFITFLAYIALTNTIITLTCIFLGKLVFSNTVNTLLLEIIHICVMAPILEQILKVIFVRVILQGQVYGEKKLKKAILISSMFFGLSQRFQAINQMFYKICTYSILFFSKLLNPSVNIVRYTLDYYVELKRVSLTWIGISLICSVFNLWLFLGTRVAMHYEDTSKTNCQSLLPYNAILGHMRYNTYCVILITTPFQKYHNWIDSKLIKLGVRCFELTDLLALLSFYSFYYLVFPYARMTLREIFFLNIYDNDNTLNQQLTYGLALREDVDSNIVNLGSSYVSEENRFNKGLLFWLFPLDLDFRSSISVDYNVTVKEVNEFIRTCKVFYKNQDLKKLFAYQSSHK